MDLFGTKVAQRHIVWIVAGTVSLESLGDALQGIMDSRADLFLMRFGLAILAFVSAAGLERIKGLRVES